MNVYATTASNVTATFYPSYSSWNCPGGDAPGAAGVREPRRPILPSDTAGAALNIPTESKSPGAA